MEENTKEEVVVVENLNPDMFNVFEMNYGRCGVNNNMTHYIFNCCCLIFVWICLQGCVYFNSYLLKVYNIYIYTCN
jgi:hypothetical protein